LPLCYHAFHFGKLSNVDGRIEVTAYIIRRLIIAVFVIVIVTMLVFLAVHLLPGDPILLYLSGSQMRSLTQEQIDLARHEFGLDKPLAVQYIHWMSDLFHGDLGMSIFYYEPVAKLIAQRLPITLHLGLLALFFSTILGVTAGTVSALRRGKKLDFVMTMGANVGITIPVFWLGILLIYLFGFYLEWLPICGYTSPFDDFWLSTKMLIMPVICLMVFAMAGDARQSRSSMLEVIRQDYVRTAWSKGLGERAVVMRHVLKNGIIPIVTLKGMGLGQILGGCVFIETVFNIPGIGRLAVEGVLSQDYAIVQGTVLITAIMVAFANLLVDLSYGWLDPRVRYS
jgi:peptide/nickel transport system permease protein